MKLTPKQQAFADYYIQTGNATEAARMAGYKGKNLNKVASENLTKLDIKQYIAEKQKVLEGYRMANMEEVREFWTETMRNSENHMRDRLKASEMIARTSGAFLDKVEVKATGEQTITVTILDDDDD